MHETVQHIFSLPQAADCMQLLACSTETLDKNGLAGSAFKIIAMLFCISFADLCNGIYYINENELLDTDAICHIVNVVK
jgi:hypothetical protein